VILMVMMILLFQGCITFQGLLKDQSDKYGRDSDSVRVLIEKGKPDFVSKHKRSHECEVLKYDQVFTYIKRYIERGKGSYDRGYIIEEKTMFHFMNGKFVKI